MGPSERFNRTFMELKSVVERMSSARVKCFNRTFMELKCHLMYLLMTLNLRFNRTFMELKWKQLARCLRVLAF